MDSGRSKRRSFEVSWSLNIASCIRAHALWKIEHTHYPIQLIEDNMLRVGRQWRVGDDNMCVEDNVMCYLRLVIIFIRV